MIICVVIMLTNFCPITEIFGQDAFDLQISSLKEKYPMPKLTKEQMYEDFDTLTSIMKNCNAQYLVRKKVTGFDMLREMKYIRPQIDTISSTQSFIKLLKRTLALTQDEHCYIGDNVWWYRHSIYKKEARHLKNRDYGYNFHYIDIFREDDLTLKLIHIDHRYYLEYPTWFYVNNDSVGMKAGTEITLINNIKASSFIDSVSKYQFNTEWDFRNKSFYTNSLFNWVNMKCVTLMVENQPLELSFSAFMQETPGFSPQSILFDSVKYIAQDSTLLLRISSMLFSVDRMKKFQEKILSCKSYGIKRVVVDIRGNHGGSDKKWESLLQTIIETPINYHFSLITNDNDESSKYMPDRLKDKKIKFNFIDSSVFYRVDYDEEYVIKPFTENLGYKGKIYILQDEDIYSSAKSFCSLNSKTERIVTIGIPTGKLVGQGGNPRVFILPKTKLIFTLDVLLDASGVNKAEDFYHDSVNYPITPTLNYYLYRLKTKKEELLDEKNLHEFDEVYKKVLELR